jgi:hypothetical protein
MNVKGNHPISEIIARKTFGIEHVPFDEKCQMISRCQKAVREYHEKALSLAYASGLERGLIRASEIADEFNSIEGIAQQIKEAIRNEVGK